MIQEFWFVSLYLQKDAFQVLFLGFARVLLVYRLEMQFGSDTFLQRFLCLVLYKQLPLLS
ncbi:MAG: hypothetical protein D8H97_42705 [Neisseria sp.]|nr:MAG: hypothetical protein D8H97_42705 [Neisseria sp.]